MSLNGLGVTRGESGGVSMMLKTGMEVAQYYSVFKYGPPRPQNDINSQDKTIVVGQRVNLAPKFVIRGKSKDKVSKESPPDAFIVDKL